MFEKKRIVFLLASAALVTACGGGSDANENSRGGGSMGAPTTTTNPGNPPPAGNDPGGGSVMPSDQRLAGQLQIVANQVVYIRTNRSIYLPVMLNQLESDTGIYDIAPGTNEAESAADLPPPAPAPAAPIAAFGIRVNRFVQATTNGEVVGNQTVVGRIAMDLSEREDSPGVGATGMPEIMKFVIDRVQLSTDANGELVSATVLDGARMHVYGRTAIGVEVRETIPVPAAAVRLLPISEVPDNHGDDSSVVLLMDFETAFAQAGQSLTALENISGHFTMHLTLSSAQINRPAHAASSLEEKDLVGQPIAVNDQPVASGGGISGNAWIRMNPPQGS